MENIERMPAKSHALIVDDNEDILLFVKGIPIKAMLACMP
jgi:hypothetical protein